ncbi:hypothetical protein RFI_06837 [Reticulomyxa filosa]|uniref:Uncharacterized protein n=1 Tax=Reticulomyxa filosa TaxID=46433 RepID=X6NYB3_RETFI|nr:hypothetical protein RFI_06837 [Reticulomyxa filosa]|eukprot:ETO30282.1 hypothetical protein RFI_06837 [Reticulomyxa filosa]
MPFTILLSEVFFDVEVDEKNIRVKNIMADQKLQIKFVDWSHQKILEYWFRGCSEDDRPYPLDLIKLILKFCKDERLSFRNCKIFGHPTFEHPENDGCIILMTGGKNYTCIVMNEEYSVITGIHTWRIQTQKNVANKRMRTFWLTIGIGIVGEEYTPQFFCNAKDWSISNWQQTYIDGSASDNSWYQWDRLNHFVLDMQLDVEKKTLTYACVYTPDKNSASLTKPLFSITCQFPPNAKLVPRFVFGNDLLGMVQIISVDNICFVIIQYFVSFLNSIQIVEVGNCLCLEINFGKT